MAAIANGLQFILNKIIAFAQWFLDVFLQVFVDFWEIFTDVFVWVFDQILGVVVAIVSTLDTLPGFSTVNTATSWFSQIPPEMLNILGLIGAGDALAIIAAALMIRFALGLIPLVRVGR